MEAPFELPIQGPMGGLPIMNPASQQQQSGQQPPQARTSPQRIRSQKDSSSSVVRDRDARLRRSPTITGKDEERNAARVGKPRMRLSPNALPKSLLPVTERKMQDGPKTDKRVKKDTEGEKWDIAPDGSSAGREGRQFTVANVGNNGRIYLRPSVRPANQRYPQPHFVFPMTPPSTAGLDKLTTEETKAGEELDRNQLHSGQWTPSLIPSTPNTTRKAFLPEGRQGGHRRAISDSTIPDTSVARESDIGGFKIVITQPGDDQRPKTVEDIDPTNGLLLDVAIPSWKLGNPRFTLRGTPLIRGSSYAPTEEFPASNRSILDRTPRNMTPRPDSSLPQRPFQVKLPPGRSGVSSGPASPRMLMPLRATYLSTHLVIEPAMFDPLTFKPACDDRTIVRYSPSTNAVTAATPPRLVAEITSPTFLDYELLSDFFLTYRSFLEPSDLLRMLVARLRWALARDDEIGMVVRVRTFVALRHWILNYFMDDYVIDYSLRVTFCNLLNDFVEELSQDPRGLKVQLKILSELKKCWRRVCAQYWDGPEFDTALDPNGPIAPGGIAGHRNASLDPSFWEQEDDEAPPRLDEIVAQIKNSQGHTSFYADVSRAGHLDSVVHDDRPGTPEDRITAGDSYDRHQASPTSITSVDVISCSFPSKVKPGTQHTDPSPLAAHPVDPLSLSNAMGPIATTPRALTGKRVRPTQHKRNVSLTDSLRDHPIMSDRHFFKDTDLIMSIPYAGSLVRGAMLPPGQPFVEVIPPSSAGGQSRQTTLFQPHPLEAEKEKTSASAVSSQGMRKLLGSVRRALSTKIPGAPATQGSLLSIRPISPRGATNRLPGTAVVPQATLRVNGARPPVRIDLLGAEVAEDFKKAVREDAAAEAAKIEYDLPSPISVRIPDEKLEYSAAHLDSAFDVLGQMEDRPFSDMGITTGSKSIVIVDDTLQLEAPSMAGALPAVNSSVEAFAETFMPDRGDLTPPNTPPDRAMGGTPRRSSYILSQHVLRPSTAADSLPPITPEMTALAREAEGRPSVDTMHLSHDFARPSIDYVRQSSDRPPLSAFRMHTRQHSSRSYISNKSFGRRRFASLTSGGVPPTIRSFDATTYSEGSVDALGEVPMPQPLRVLRRRPGGDLRAVEHVGQLDHAPLRRSRSVGSLTTYTDSIQSSFMRSPVQDSSGFVDVVSSNYSRDRDETFSLGAIAEQKPKRQLSLFSTHSSKPVMRPSFEAEAQKLAQIPDDVDDDGGVESALLKLEGKFEKKSPRPSLVPSQTTQDPTEVIAKRQSSSDATANTEEKREHRHQHVGEGAVLAQEDDVHDNEQKPTSNAHQTSLLSVPQSSTRLHEEAQSFFAGSNESYSSIPLLERGLTDDGRSKAETREWTNHSILDDAPTPSALSERDDQNSKPTSFEFARPTHNGGHADQDEGMPQSPGEGTVSFLDDESNGGSDLSSEFSADLSDEDEDPLEYRGGRLTRSNTVASRLPAHPLGDPDEPPSLPQSALPPPPLGPPPSPPSTVHQAARRNLSETENIPQLHDHQLWEEKPLPPTPDTAPTTVSHSPSLGSPDPTGRKEALRNAPRMLESGVARKYSVHLPFILAFDSEILAQQFTLIEKDALNEIDWKDLIEMQWKNAENSDVRSWVDFLRNTDAHGVEVVIARFNIMVKWAVSEVILTQDIEERARCIIKCIHIASHCRRYRNFATMSQLTIALTSKEVSRLTKTWAMVPAHDLQTLRDLEMLVTPTRNFYNLRAEMEAVGIESCDTGCIPFVGVYTHDLLFNAQRPSEIASSPTTAPLVNFERCRIAASIVKTLLRLLEASTLYDFQPIEGITERCLWMSALSDEEIRRYSQALQ
ncbi:uncharacterized protein E0L32_009699 [Thyridium curvatum]|uniref:Guanine nucleotide exchange factor LTE1 n=1 Tax=Thyridium curvatum TaxID=1093900 RepID=A0A507AVC9_9PEZI|nr:uncharacterized protein E0L32_009699 [Thyridium curvatum]TPX08881.1 hypothetical protein E0L32_009699 [Thyridium curvatum]